LLPSLANPYFADVASVIISEVHRRNYTTIVIDTMENAKNFNDSASVLLSRRVDGIIAVPCGTDSTLIESINDNYLPVVLIDRYYDDTHLSFVTTNNHKGGLMATRHLIGMGHRRIACIQGTVTSNPSKERVRGYRDAMIEEGFEEDIRIVGNEFSIQNGYLETKLLLESDNPPTAIFTLSNTITLGALKAIREASLKIPEDISLISFDNYSYMDFMEPPITRISQPTEDMGKLATKILFDRIDSVPNNTSQLKLSPSLIAKESVRGI
jgi:LacI family transcriptional regulator